MITTASKRNIFLFACLFFQSLVFCQNSVDFTFDPATQCIGGPTTFHNNTTGNYGLNPEWTWSFGDGTQVTVNNLSDVYHTYASPGIYSVGLWFEGGFSAGATHYIEIFSPGTICTATNGCPQAGFYAWEICRNRPSSFFNTSYLPDGISDYTYSWNFGDPGSSNNTSTDFEPQHQFIGLGPFDVTLTVTNLAGTCSSTVTKTINYVDQLFGETITPDNSVINVGEDVTFTFSGGSPPPDFNGVPTYFKYNFGDGNITNWQPIADIVNPVTHAYAAPGIYNVIITLSTIECFNYVIIPVMVTSCTTSTFGNSFIEFLNILINNGWSSSFDLSTLSPAPAFFSTPQFQTMVPSYSSGCSPFYCYPTIVTNSTTGDQTLSLNFVLPSCGAAYVNCGEFQVESPYFPYYTFDDITGIEPGIFVSSSGNYQLIANTSSGQQIVINSGSNMCFTGEDLVTCICPTPSFTVTPCLPCPGSVVTFTNTYTGDLTGASFEWDFGDGSSTVNTFNATHAYSAPGTYNVTLTLNYSLEFACTEEVTIPVVIEDCGSTLTCTLCIRSFAPIAGEKYVVSGWVKQSGAETQITYDQPNITLGFTGYGTLGPFYPEGIIIDGWQRIEEEFTVPFGTTEISVNLNNNGSSGDVYFDDIRIHPFNGNMKSFVYDPVSLRLMAELDENNYATFYEYDEEGALIRVKKETERGIKTIKESGNNTKKN